MLSRRMWFALGLGFLLGIRIPAASRDMPMAKPPTLPAVEWNVCPFEGCTYREWTAAKPVTLYSTWQTSRKQVGSVRRGEKVVGVTGLVVTFRPGRIRLDRDYPDTNDMRASPSEPALKRGDVLLTYTYRGEGFSAVWFGGTFYSEFDISFTKWPDGSGCGGEHCAATYVDLGRKQWWAKVKLRPDRTAWVNMNQAQFNGVDALGL